MNLQTSRVALILFKLVTACSENKIKAAVDKPIKNKSEKMMDRSKNVCLGSLV